MRRFTKNFNSILMKLFDHNVTLFIIKAATKTESGSIFCNTFLYQTEIYDTVNHIDFSKFSGTF